MTLTPARLVVALLLVGAGLVAYAYLRSDWVEVDERDFSRRVLQARVPALVYFDAAAGCRGADSVFRQLSRKRRGSLDVFYVNSTRYPELARAYGVQQDVVFVLFDRGQVLRWATAPMILGAATAKNNGVYSDEGFLAEMELFVTARATEKRA